MRLPWYAGDLPANFFENSSYARLAGAYIRHLERLPCLQKAFDRFFEVKKISQTIRASSYRGTPKEYPHYLSVRLKATHLTQDDILLIKQSLGIKVKAITPGSTIENTIPFKKVLEMLTCFNPVKYHDCPWLVSFMMFGEKRKFLLSPYPEADKQLMVSMYRHDNYGGGYVGSAYTWLIRKDILQVEAGVVDGILSCPLSHLTGTVPSSYRKDLALYYRKSSFDGTWKLIFEFIVCTQVAESHCTPGYLQNSRVPGEAKHARALCRYHSAEETKEKYLDSSFNIESAGFRKFPMAGDRGTSNTRTAVNKLTIPKDKAPCTDMSEDSELEDINEGECISGEGK